VERLAEPDGCGLDPSHGEHVRNGVINGIAMIEAGMGLPSTMKWVQVLEQNAQRRVTGMQLRSLYHLWQGNAVEANRLKREVELLLIQENLQSLKIDTGFEVVQGDVRKVLQRWQDQSVQFDYIFLDPPYRMEEIYGRTLEGLGGSHLPKTGGLVIAEHQKKFDPGEAFASLRRFRKLEQGDAALSFYRKI